MGTTYASLRADAARAVNRAYAKFWLHRGRWQAGDPVDARVKAWLGGRADRGRQPVGCDRLSVRLGPGCTRAVAAVASRHLNFHTRRPR